MMKLSLLLALFSLFLFASCVTGQDLVFKNSCSFPLWAEGRGKDNSLIPGETNPLKYMAPGSSVSWTVPAAGLASTRFWAKYGCNSNGANCLIGDQIRNTNLYPNGGCPAGGCSPPLDSLFEATWGCKLGSACGSASQVTWFDTSQVDGYTMPYRLLISGNTQCDCTSSGCTNLQLIDASKLNLASCPTNENLSNNNNHPQNANQNLRYIVNGLTVACKSPCKHLTLPVVHQGKAYFEGSPQAVYYCCPTPNPSNCQPSQGCTTPAVCQNGPIEGTKYVQTVHAQTDNVYAYTYDDLVGLHTCPAAGVKYTMEFCPPGSPPYPIGATSSSSSSSSSTSGSSSTCNANCGSGLSCCNTAANGPACYSPSQHTCALNDINQNVLCQAGFRACRSSCYNPAIYKCVNGNLQQL